MLGLGLGLGRNKFTGGCPTPVITSVTIATPGGIEIGDTLIGNFSTSSPYSIVEYRWTRNNAPIGGATVVTYEITPEDIQTSIRLEVRIQNDCGNWSNWLISDPVVPEWYAAYQTLLTKLIADGVTEPDLATKVLDNQFLVDMGADLVKHAGLYKLGAYDATAALYNMANPTDGTVGKCSYVNAISASDWTFDLGYNTVAASGLNTGIVPSTAPEIDADNCTLWMWVDNISSLRIYMGVLPNTGTSCYMGVEYAGIYSRINSHDPEFSGGISAAVNFLAMKRKSATEVDIYENGIYKTTITRSFYSICSSAMYILGASYAGSVYNGGSTGIRCYAAGIAGDIDVANVYNALLTRKS